MRYVYSLGFGLAIGVTAGSGVGFVLHNLALGLMMGAAAGLVLGLVFCVQPGPDG